MNHIEKISTQKIIKYCAGKKIGIFGAGADGLRFYKNTFGELTIECFIDNHCSENLTFLGHKMCTVKQCKKVYNVQMIIVTSLAYYEEMVKQLIDEGYSIGTDFVVWDGAESDYYFDFTDKNIRKFINQNFNIWKYKKKNVKGKNKILIPYRSSAEIVYPAWGYAANYLATEYNADIFCIGGVRDILNEDIYKIYQSFNVVGFINETPDSEQKKEIERIFDGIWSKIKTKKDIKSIEIYGENFGTDILRDYLRLCFPKYFRKDYTLKKQLKEMIGYVVFWHHYFLCHKDEIKAVIVWDGIYYREGIIRKIAYGYGIPVYTVDNRDFFKWGYEDKFSYEYYKKFYNMLSEEEKRTGVEWAKKKLDKHVSGYVEKFDMGQRSVFGEIQTDKRVLEKNKKIKVMICPHYSEDDPFPYGDNMLFDDPWDWLEYLGELSNSLNYDWYLKPHPIEKKLGNKLIEDYLRRYPKIKLLPRYVSPVQLQKEGMQFALTIHGSIGYEYPYIGIKVINAGYNPHISFDFCCTPKSFAEYEDILKNLDSYNKTICKEEIYQFYCIHFGYYRAKKIDLRTFLYIDERLKDIRGLIDSKTNYTTELFYIYTNEMTEERHNELKKKFCEIFKQADEFQEGVFYKKTLE